MHIVLHTLRSIFPSMQVWVTRPRDMVLVCGKSDAALPYGVQSIRERMNQQSIQDGLNCAWRVDDMEGVLAHFVCGNQTIDRLLNQHDLPLNTDDRNLLEYAFAKTVGQSTRFSIQSLQLCG